METGKWYHIAVSYDADGNGPQPGHQAFINGDRISGDVDAANFKTFSSTNFPSAGNVEYYIGTGDLSGSSSISDFDGVIDEVRWMNYERNAFAGGVMISQVVPSTNTITIYNSGDFSVNLAGIEIYNGASSCSFSGTLNSGSTDTCSLTVGTTDGIYMVDINGDNTGGADTGADEDAKEWVTDGVCWQSDSSGTDSECDSSSDTMIDAAVWAEDVYMDLSEGDGDTLKLKSNGNNDEAASDWFVPEFSTILMPIASVMLIVGYSYRKKENLES